MFGIRRPAARSRGSLACQVKFLVDAQLSHKVAAWLIAQGHEAQAVREVGLRDADDCAIWRHALQTGAAILTKDEDFAARSAQAANAPVVVWLRIAQLLERGFAYLAGAASARHRATGDTGQSFG